MTSVKIFAMLTIVLQGFCVMRSGKSPVSTMKLYQSYEICNLIAGFTILSSGNTSVCMWRSQLDYLNYTQARDQCLAKRANLFTVKDVDKLNIAKLINVDFYIGLEDIGRNRTFFWTDDMSVLDESLKLQIFNKGEPNNYAGNEYCVQYAGAFGKVRDVPCNWTANVVCENNCFRF
ncbi:C-type lectin mannose-binding isoform [Biomphalaria glabrata]|nr:C-type lectin mannose-binding isoform-like [Biomphalaria glabrata]